MTALGAALYRPVACDKKFTPDDKWLIFVHE